MYEYQVKSVDRIVDGDTYYFTVDLGFFVQLRVKIRLLDVDTPESYRPSCDAELEHAREAKAFVEDVFNRAAKLVVRTQVDPKQTFGRWLADISVYSSNGAYSDLAILLREAGYEKRTSYE
jgi:endonuclease YncB( thermonuclease family)